MGSKRIEDVYEAAIEALSATADDALARADGEGYPDREEVAGWTERVKAVVLHQRDRGRLRADVPALAERLLRLLVKVGVPEGFDPEAVVAGFVERLPEVRRRLAEDVEAAFEGDPAAKSFGEIVASYPSIDAIAIHRLAHELVKLGVPQIPRIMSEHAHARTGIDIHPGARIGRRFFIDHGTGVVIGETCDIGNHVKIYQGVTLGALSFATDSDGNLATRILRYLPDDLFLDNLDAEYSESQGNWASSTNFAWGTDARVAIEPPRLQVRSRADDLRPVGDYEI